MPKPKASRPAAPPKPTPPPVAVKRTSRVRVQAPKRATMPSQDAALAAMVGTGPMMVAGLAAPLGISAYMARRVMRRLEGAGLVRRAVQGWVVRGAQDGGRTHTP